MLISAAKKTIPRGGYRKIYVPCWDEECNSLYHAFQCTALGNETRFASEKLLCRLDQRRQSRWVEAVDNIDFTHSSREAWKTVNTTARKYGFAEDLAIMHTVCSWQEAEEVLNQDMARLCGYLRKRRLELSEKKTVSASFHLNNKEAKHELNIKINGSCLTHQEIPTYLGVKLDRTLTYCLHLEMSDIYA